MRRIVSLILTLSLSIFSLPKSHSIENGSDATGSTHVVKIFSTYNKAGKVNTCSGGVLSEWVVVTAAHCVVDESGLLSAQIWSLAPGIATKRNSDGVFIRDSTWIPVDSTKATLTYQTSSTGRVSNDDLAFLILSQPIKLEIRTVIPSEEETLKLKEMNSTLRLYGYGSTTDSGNVSDTPNFFVANFDALTPTAVKNSGYASSTKASACSGDSGGPVLSVTTVSVTVVGVITGGPASNYCGKKLTDGKFYTLFTYLSRYANLAFSAASEANKISINLAQTEQRLAEEIALQNASDLISAEDKISELTQALESAQSELQILKEKVLNLETEAKSLLKQVETYNSRYGRTIVCVKGKIKQKVSAIEPKCPQGFRKT